MRVFVFVNQVQEIGYRQTTALLIAAYCRLGAEVYLADVDGLSMLGAKLEQPNRSIQFSAFAIQIPVLDSCDSNSIAKFAEMAEANQFSNVTIEMGDLVCIRTNPGRDTDRVSLHSAFLDLCCVAKLNGIRIVNDPSRLSFFASKASVALLPLEYRPEMLVTNNLKAAVQFIEESGFDCVVKPLMGSRGNNVLKIASSSPDTERLVREQLQSQSIVIQHLVESDVPGDKRVVVVNGKLLEYGDHVAGIHRIPTAGDFRANLHAGGTAEPLRLSTFERDAALAAGSLLFDNGIQLAGIDLIAGKVIEFNVFSTGGIFDANRFANFDFATEIAKRLR